MLPDRKGSEPTGAGSAVDKHHGGFGILSCVRRPGGPEQHWRVRADKTFAVPAAM